jgi:hypothetical protein
MIKGEMKFDAISIGKLSADFLKETLHLEATAAFADSSTGETHGWTKGDGRVWSKETMQALVVLRESMERDLAKLHFSDGAGTSTAAASEPSGIGERLGSAAVDAPSV